MITVVAMVPFWLTALTLVSATDAIATCPLRLAERQAGALNLQIIKPPLLQEAFSVMAVRRNDREDAGVDWLMTQIKTCTRGPNEARKSASPPSRRR